MTQTIMTKSLNLILGVTLSLSIVSCSSGGEDGIQDCNLNGVEDALDIDAGAGDCNSDGVLDECELADGAADRYALVGGLISCAPDGIPDYCQVVPDCDADGLPNFCEIVAGSPDRYGKNGATITCGPDGIPDTCQPAADCDVDGLPDFCEIQAGALDLYGKTGATSFTCGADGIPDSCQSIPANLNRYGVGAGGVITCVGDNLPDSCQPVPDCDTDGIPNFCEIQSGAADRYGATGGTVSTCVADGIPDSCQPAADCDTDGTPDFCEITVQGAADRYGATAGVVSTCLPDGIPDSCQTAADCDTDGTPNFCEITVGGAEDCDNTTVPDSCQIAANPSLDLDVNGRLDSCQDPAQVIVMLTDAPSDEFLSLVALLDTVQFVNQNGSLTTDVLTPSVRVELMSTATSPLLLSLSTIPFGTYTGVRLGFTGAPVGRLNNGTASPVVNIAGGGTTFTLNARFAAPTTVGENSLTRCLVDFDLEWSLVPNAVPATSYTLTPIGETRILTTPAGTPVEPIRGEVIAVNTAAGELTLRAFVDDDCTARAGDLVVQLAGGIPLANLFDSTGQQVVDQTTFLNSLTVNSTVNVGFGTVLEVHGVMQENGALRASRVNTENGRLNQVGGGSNGGSIVEFDGIVITTPATTPAGVFSIAVSDVEMGRSTVLTALGSIPTVHQINYDVLTRYIDATGTPITDPIGALATIVPGMRVKVKYTEFNTPSAALANQASLVEVTNSVLDFEGTLNSIAGLGGIPPTLVMRLDADEWAIQAGQVTNSTTNVTVGLGTTPQAPVFLRVTGSPAITLGNIPIDSLAPLDSNIKLDTVGVRSGAAGSPTIAATQLRLYPGRIRGGVVVDLAPQPNGELLLKLSTTQVIDPFGQNYIDNQTRVILLPSASVLGDRTTLSNQITVQELIALANDPTCDLEVIAKGLSSTDPLDNNSRYDIYELRIRCR